MKFNKKHKEKLVTFSPRRERIHEIIFEAETREGKLFDIALLFFIVLSIIVVFLETVPSLKKYDSLFYGLEVIFTIFFTIEYLTRIYCVYRPWKYITSFYGIIDLLAILPVFLELFLPTVGFHSLMVIRSLRLLRVFRIFKLANYTTQGMIIVQALKDSRSKMAIFTYFVMLCIVIFGSIMYVVEGGSNPNFDSIPRSVYWAIVTLTTVGYGDISPITPLGQFLASVLMILGYAVIAVPTGIVSNELIKQQDDEEEIRLEACRYCSREGHALDAIHCKYCGEKLNDDELKEL